MLQRVEVDTKVREDVPDKFPSGRSQDNTQWRGVISPKQQGRGFAATNLLLQVSVYHSGALKGGKGFIPAALCRVESLHGQDKCQRHPEGSG